MTQAVEYEVVSGFRNRVEIWYILEANLPSEGSNTVSISATGTPSTLENYGICMQYDGVFQSTPEATDGVDQTVGTTITNTISPSTDSWVLSAVVSGQTPPIDFSHDQGQVEQWEYDDASSVFAVTELQGANGETSVSSTQTGTINRLVRVAASFKPASSSTDYQMDQEGQFEEVYESSLVSEELRIKTGTFGGIEDINVTYWDGNSWELIASDLTPSSWNNFTINGLSVTEPYFTIKFGGSTTSGDSTQDWWMIDAVLVYVEEHVVTTKEDYVDNQNSDMDSVADVGILTDFVNLQDTDNTYANLSESIGETTGKILFVDSVQATSTTQTVVLPAPTVSDGDFMIAVIGMPDDDPLAPITITTIPTGWNEAVGKTNMDNLAVSPPAVWVYTKVASSESGTYTWAGTNSPLGTGSVGVLYVFSGVNSTLGTYGIINTLKSSQTGTGNDPIAPSISTTVGDTVMAFAWTDNGLQTVNTFPSSDGLTGEESPSIDPPTGNNGMVLSAGYEGNVTTTTSGTYSWTIGTVPDERSAFTFNIRPASGSSSGWNDWTSELLSNGGFEDGNFGSWTVQGANWAVGADAPMGSAGTQAGSYTAFQTQPSTATDYIYQEVDLTSYASYITDGRFVVNASGWRVSSEYPAQDLSKIVIQYLDSGHGLISTPLDTGFDDLQFWTKEGIYNVTVPTNTRYIRIFGYTDEGNTYDSGNIDSFSVKVRTKEANGSNSYHLDQEVQFVGIYDSPNLEEQLCIKTGSFGGTENISVAYWDGDSWETITSDLTASTWNNYSITPTSPTFTIKFSGSTTSSDSVQDWWEIDSVLLKVETAEGAVGKDSGFVWLDTPDEVDLGTTYNSWVEQDLSDDSVPSLAMGVILAWVEDSVTNLRAVARGAQDTNDYMDGGSSYNQMEAETWKMQILKLKDHRYIDTWRQSSTERLYVMGYTLGEDPQYRRVPAHLGSLTADSTWQTMTVRDIDDDTNGVILFARSKTNQDSTIMVRAVGSTDSMTNREWENYVSGTFFVKLDANDQFEYYITSGRLIDF
ncbi:MAG: hypothetical protein ACW99Q_18230, partial [Candidatus Kariarchaeaceae archaeon]